MKRVGIFIGRFQPFHDNHLKILNDGLENLDNVVVLIGSANKASSIKNPFTYEERKEMILSSIDTKYFEKIIFCSLNDYLYDEDHWISNVLNVQYLYEKGTEFYLMGIETDHSSYYLKNFPEFNRFDHSHNDYEQFHSSDIRTVLFSKTMSFKEKVYFFNCMVPQGVVSYLKDYIQNPDSNYLILQREFYKIQEEEKLWSNSPYPVQVNCADLIVQYKDKILLIERKGEIGYGLLAMPGGHINQNETFLDCAIREAGEETGLTKEIIESCMISDRPFLADSPYRSNRSVRVISNVFVCNITNMVEGEPILKAADDALTAKFYNLNDFNKISQTRFHDDHHEILKMFIK